MQLEHLGMVGYGEVGKLFASGLKGSFKRVCAWDLKFSEADAPPALREAEIGHANQAGVHACESLQALCAQSDFVISAVTAANTLAVAQTAAPLIRPGTVFLDLNSASPGTKQQCARLIDAAGGHYVEAGVMTSVPPYGIRVPMLLGGAQAQALSLKLGAMGMDAKAVASDIGVASAIKMCRSVMIKGLEALVIESYSTARKYGVENHMLPTLAETFPSIDWEKTGAYFFSRVAKHGKRRAQEMREAANTVREAGFAPWMAAAIAEKHDWVAAQSAAGVFEDLPNDATWQAFADRLIARSSTP
jgi:3-hydroxyisobutyrate dehydrogenase-like beta-hydroxyacid dehydrogenase